MRLKKLCLKQKSQIIAINCKYNLGFLCILQSSMM